jgi:hypothetical protein
MSVGVRTAVAAALITCSLFSLVALREVSRADGNYSVLLRISERALRANPLLRDRTAVRERLVVSPGGYDGQFTYFAAFDPLLTRYAHAPDNYVLMMDMAPYRYGRIGHVWLTRLVAGADWRRYPATLVWTVLLGCLWSALALSAIATHAGRSAWWGAAIALIPGFWQSVQLALPEPIAAAAVLTGLACCQRRWWGAAALAFAAALLTRETAVIAVFCVCLGTFARGHQRPAVLILLAALVPTVLWRWHVATVLYPVFGVEAFAFNPGTFGWPMAGMVNAWTRVLAGTYHPGAPEIGRAALIFAPVLAATAAFAAFAGFRRPSAVTASAMVYAVMALCLSGITVWNHVGNVQRTSSELFLWAIVTAASWSSPPQPVSRAITVLLVVLGAFILFGAHDAATIRAALTFR